jgi:hypothetical protein
MGQRAEDVGDLDGGSGTGHADEIADGAGVRDHVHADAAGAGALAVEHAKHDGRDRQDHDDFNSDSKGADARAQRTMDEITDNQLIHSVTSVGDSGGKACVCGLGAAVRGHAFEEARS